MIVGNERLDQIISYECVDIDIFVFDVERSEKLLCFFTPDAGAQRVEFHVMLFIVPGDFFADHHLGIFFVSKNFLPWGDGIFIYHQ
jgi:hypothetical protein